MKVIKTIEDDYELREENSKLIAEFMGYRKFQSQVGVLRYTIPEHAWESRLPAGNYRMIDDFSCFDMQYFKSYDWLIPVVNKCYSIAWSYHSKDMVSHHFSMDVIEIEKVYLAVIEFIKLYNKNKL